jgi:hypothetical protein
MSWGSTGLPPKPLHPRHQVFPGPPGEHRVEKQSVDRRQTIASALLERILEEGGDKITLEDIDRLTSPGPTSTVGAPFWNSVAIQLGIEAKLRGMRR